MKRYIRSTEDILCMAGVRGRRIKTDPNVNFSFYYSSKNSSHGPRVKVGFDPDNIEADLLNNLQLTEEWDFTVNPKNGKIKSKDINSAKAFFKKYLILFLLVWDKQTKDELSLGDYLQGEMTLLDFIHKLKFYDEYSEELDKIQTVSELEQFCRDNKLVNMYGN